MAQVLVEELSSNGLHVIQGELSILLNSMRRPFKWSSQIYQVICQTFHSVLKEHTFDLHAFILSNVKSCLFSNQIKYQVCLPNILINRRRSRMS